MFRYLVLFVGLIVPWSCILADSELPTENLDVEHRGGKAESFLDGIASLFGGAGDKQDERPVGPIYRPAQGPPNRKQVAAPSIQRPIAVPPPQSFKKQPFYPPIPPRVGTSASNLSPVSQPGKDISLI